jgi:hypothetical protein
MRILGTVASSSREVPGAPTIGTATNVGSGRAYNNGRADVTFTAPAVDGGFPILDYTVTSSPGGFTATGASSPLTVTGLQSSVSYTFTVTARTAIGTGPASAASNSITATTVPQAPTIGAAADGGTGTTATVAYTANATGGAAISTFTATSSPGSLTGTGASPITVSGLTTGTAYTFTVTATNANGTSAASAASNSVTPASPSSYESIATLNFSTPTYIAQFNSIPSTYKHLQIRYRVGDDGAGAMLMQLNNNTTFAYAWHYLRGDGGLTSASNNSSTTYIRSGELGTSKSNPTVGIIDILDYASTTKAKTIRYINGYDNNGSGLVQLGSGLWTQTNAINAITLQFGDVNPATVALYGIKG